MTRITTKNDKILKEIEKIFARQLYNEIVKKSKMIREDIKQYNINLWKNTATYQSLISGKLTHEFGIPEGTSTRRVDVILNLLAESITVIPKIPRRSGKNFRVMRINVFSKTIRPDIFEIPEAKVDTGKSLKNDISSDFGSFGASAVRKELPWLRWLLYEGNKFLIYNYRYEDVIAENSRSGKGLMIRDDTQNWRVPSEFSGTRNSNWIVKALQDNARVSESVYKDIIKKYLLG